MKNLSRSHGFTLIELLIVIIIISIVGGAAMLSINHNQNTRLANIGKELANLIVLAQEEAMLKPKILGLGFTRTTFQFYEYNENKTAPNDKTPAWQPITAGELGLHTLPAGVQLTIKVRKKVAPIEPEQPPQLIISTSGDIIPFTIFIGKPGSEPRYQVVGNANGSITNGPIQN